MTAPAGYLLDTSVLSLLAPDRAVAPSAALVHWMLQRSDRMFIPCIAIAEIEQGICKLHRAGGTVRAERLSHWLDGLVERYSDRILPLDAAVSRLAGRMAEQALAKGRHPGFPDVAIAALAQGHQLLLLSRNLKHFLPLEVPCADPTERLPD